MHKPYNTSMRFNISKVDLNNSVQHPQPSDDFANSVKNGMRKNIFSISDRDTTNTSESTNKYYNASVNFNNIRQNK